LRKEIQLVDGHIIVQPYHPDDAKRLYEAVRESITGLSPWMPWCHQGYSIEETRQWLDSCCQAWDKGNEYEFAITDSRDGVFLGGVGLNRIDIANRIANLGYWTRTSRTRSGVATTAARLLVGFAFRELKLNRLEIIVATANKASQRVAEKLGATREGILRNRLVIHDRVHDAVMFSLVPGDLKQA
jgi:ribosomal-protein-serine acetyltransferase